MKDSGESKKPVATPAKKPQWQVIKDIRDITNLKLRQYEAIGMEVMGKRRGT